MRDMRRRAPLDGPWKGGDRTGRAPGRSLAPAGVFTSRVRRKCALALALALALIFVHGN